VVALPNDGGHLRVIAGSFAGQSGPAQTFTPMNVWDLRLKAGRATELEVAEGHNAVLVVLNDSARVNGTDIVPASSYVVFAQTGGGITVEAQASEVKCLLLTGEPLNEPIAGYGPFVMNTEDEIRQAFKDYQQGLFGTVAAVTGSVIQAH
jgi:redox-sensitive bicupin YhaK (pirin superfamily)